MLDAYAMGPNKVSLVPRMSVWPCMARHIPVMQGTPNTTLYHQHKLLSVNTSRKVTVCVVCLCSCMSAGCVNNTAPDR